MWYQKKVNSCRISLRTHISRPGRFAIRQIEIISKLISYLHLTRSILTINALAQTVFFLKMTSQDRLKHARHNKEVCDYLDANTSYNDWIITTAFYSAMHYVLSKIFPLADKNRYGKNTTFDTFDGFCAHFKVKNGEKHRIVADLVSFNCNAVSPDYDHLKSLCWTARYHSYQFNRRTAKSALKSLKSIHRLCDKPTTP